MKVFVFCIAVTSFAQAMNRNNDGFPVPDPKPMNRNNDGFPPKRMILSPQFNHSKLAENSRSDLNVYYTIIKKQAEDAAKDHQFFCKEYEKVLDQKSSEHVLSPVPDFLQPNPKKEDLIQNIEWLSKYLVSADKINGFIKYRIDQAKTKKAIQSVPQTEPKRPKSVDDWDKFFLDNI